MKVQEAKTTLEQKIDKYREILERAPDDRTVLLALAEASFRRGLRLEALQAYQRVLEADSVPEAHLAMAQMYLQHGLVHEVFDELARLFASEPENPEAHILATQLAEEHEVPESVAPFLEQGTTAEAIAQSRIRLGIHRSLLMREIQELSRMAERSRSEPLHDYYVYETQKRISVLDSAQALLDTLEQGLELKRQEQARAREREEARLRELAELEEASRQAEALGEVEPTEETSESEVPRPELSSGLDWQDPGAEPADSGEVPTADIEAAEPPAGPGFEPDFAPAPAEEAGAEFDLTIDVPLDVPELPPVGTDLTMAEASPREFEPPVAAPELDLVVEAPVPEEAPVAAEPEALPDMLSITPSAEPTPAPVMEPPAAAAPPPAPVVEPEPVVAEPEPEVMAEPEPEPEPAPAVAKGPSEERLAFYSSLGMSMDSLVATLAKTRGVTSIYVVSRDGHMVSQSSRDEIDISQICELVIEGLAFLEGFSQAPQYWVLECNGGIVVMQTIDNGHVLVAIGQAGANFGALRYTMDKTRPNFAQLLAGAPWP